MGKDTEHTRTDRLRVILQYEPRLAAIETQIIDGTFEGDERQLKRRMHHLIGWFAENSKLRSGEHYNAVWYHLMVTKIEPLKQSAKCPVCGRFFKTVERPAMRNDSPAKDKHEIYHLMPMCEKCQEMHPEGEERQKRHLCNAHHNR